MMGHREKLVNGDEYDAFTGWRRLLKWKAGERKEIKQKYNRRIRHEHKKGLDDLHIEPWEIRLDAETD